MPTGYTQDTPTLLTVAEVNQMWVTQPSEQHSTFSSFSAPPKVSKQINWEPVWLQSSESMPRLTFLRHDHQLWSVVQQLEKPQPVSWVVSGGAGRWHLELLRMPGQQEVRGQASSTRRSAREMPAASINASAVELGQCREGGGTIALSFVPRMEQSLMMHAGTAVMPGLCAHHMGRRLSFAPTSLQRLIMLWPKMLNSPSQW